MKRLFIATLLFSAFPCLAQNYTALNGPYGGEINDMINVGGTIIGCVNGQGIVISSDNGATWTTSNSGINDYYIRDLEVNPSTGKIYALTYSRLFSSSDNGTTWITEASSGFSDAHRIKKTSSYFFIVTSSGGKVYRSTTGASWNLVTTLPGSPQITDFEVNAAGNLFITTQGQAVFRSTDNGLSFTQLDAGEGLNETDVYSITFNGSEIYALGVNAPYKSTDNGASWTSVENANLPLGSTYYSGIIESNGGSVFIILGDQVWVTADGGTSWTQVNHPTLNYGPNFYANPRSSLMESSSVMYLSFYDLGTFRTIDGGITWTETNNGITGFDIYIPGNLFYATTSNRLFYAKGYSFGMYVSIDDGASWDFITSGVNNKTIFGFKQAGATILAYGSGINKSIDNGVNWLEVMDGLVGSCYENFYALVVNGTNAYSYAEWDCVSGEGYYLLKSVNSGVNWTKNPISGLPSKSTSVVQNNNIHLDSNGDVYLQIYNYSAGVNKSEIYRVNPTSFTAVKITNLPTTSAINDTESNNGKIYVLTANNQLHYATDGATWTTKTTTTGFGNIRVINDATFYILNSNGAYISTDGGASWTNTGSFGNNRAAHEVVVSPTNYSYIAVDNAPVQKSVSPVIPPTAPTNLVVKGFSEDDVALTWDDNSNNETYFIIERSIGNNTSYDSLGTATRPNSRPQTFVYREFGGLDENTTYYYRVRASGSGGKSAYTNEVSFTTLVDCKATSNIPLNRSWTATTLNESGVGVMTDAAVSITSGGSPGFYTISNLNAGSSAAVHPDTEAFIVENCGSVMMFQRDDIQRSNGTWNSGTNTLTIQWQSNNSYTAFSETTVFQLNASDPVPAAPTDAGAYIKTQSEIVVTWTGSNFAQQYQVQRSTASGSGFVNVGSPVNFNTTLVIDNTITFSAGTTYYYRVLAINPTGTSGPSNEAIVNFQLPLFDAISLTGFNFSSQGVSWADIDNDNDEDLLVAPFVGPNTSGIQVFENMGNGTLQVITVPGVSEYQTSTYRNLSVGDINNDNLLDFLTNATTPEGGNIFINQGNKTFTKTELVPPNNSGLNWYGEFADFNNDGRLDASFSVDDIEPFGSSTSYSFFTQQPNGTFVPYVLGEIAADQTLSRGGTWADYDNDGDQDFLRGRYNNTAAHFDQLYQNNGDGTFTALSGTAFEQDFALRPRTFSWADIDNDLDLDLFIGHNAGALNNMLYQNNGDGTFTRLTTSTLTQAKTVITFGSSWGDIDNDGDQDLVTANSSQSDLYLNNGMGVFTKYATTPEYLIAFDAIRTNIAFSMADYDNNGTLDIATGKSIPNDIGFPTILLKNNLTVGTNSHWLKIKLKGTQSNYAAIGARIIITTPDTKKQMRAISAHTGYGSCNSLIAHFGLKNQTSVTSIEVHWPSGIIQTLTNQTANQQILITEDAAGPAVLNYLPLVGAQFAATTTKIAVELDEASTAVATKKMYLYKSTDLTTPVFNTDVTTATKVGNRYEFTISPKLELNTNYVVVIDAAAFKDIYGNDFLGIASGAWTFRTTPGPAITVFAPANNATNVAANTSLSITFDRTVQGVNGKSIKVFKSTDLVNPVITLSAQSGTVAGNTVTFSITPKLERQTAYSVSIDVGAFTDLPEGNDYAGLTLGAWSFTTDPGPAISTLSPVHNGSNILINAPLEVTFNKNITAVAGKKIKVMNGATALVDLDVATNGTIATNKYTLAAPVANWPYLTALNVIIDAGAFVDGSQNDFAGLTSGNWTFTTVEAPDVTAPSITFDQSVLATLEKGFATITIAVTITDNKQVASATMHHRKISEKNFTPSALTLNAGTGKWELQVPSSFADEMGFEYYFEAADNAPTPNKARLPLTDNTYFRNKINFSGSNAPSIPLPIGGTKTSWKVISIPYTLAAPQIETIFAQLGTVDKANWRMIRYNGAPTESWQEYPTSFTIVERGKGYFINTVNGGTVSLANASASDFTRDNLFSMQLVQGWNQIGNPYTVAIDWEDVRAYNNAAATVGELKKFNSGSYTGGDPQLGVGLGGFVFAQSATTIKISFDGQNVPGGGRKGFADLGTDINADEWSLKLNLYQAELKYELGAVGMAKDALPSYDVYDDVTPPRFFDYLEMNFNHPEFFAKRFTRDIVPTRSSYTWDFTVGSNLEGGAELTWDNTLLAGGVKEIYLLDISRQKLVNMKETGSYSFNPKESPNFRVYFGENLRIAPDKVHLGKAYPNPTSGNTLMAFSLPESGGLNQLVTLDVIDAMGKKIGTISQGHFNPGYHEVSWNAKELNNGFYTYRLTVKTIQGITTHANKLVIK